MKPLSNNEKFDNQLISIFQNAEPEIPANGWEKLQLKRAELNYKKKLKKRIQLFLLIFLCFSAFLSVLFYALTERHINCGNIAERKNITIHKKVSAPAAINEKTAAPVSGITENNTKTTPAINNPAKHNTFAGAIAENKKPATDNIAQTNAVPDNNKEPVSLNISKENKTVPEKTGTADLVIPQKADTAANTVAENITKDTATETTKANESIIPVITELTDTPQTGNKVPANEIHFGAHFTYNSRWILNQNTYGQFNGKELAYVNSFGTAYGIMAGYDVRRKHGYQLGIIFNSYEGQKYHDKFVFGEFYREVNLKYLRIPALYKFKWMVNKKDYPVILNFIGGLQYCRLKFAREILNGEEKDIMYHFHKNELGFVFNIEGDFYLNDFLYITTGLNSSITKNMNTTDDYSFKDDYNKSHSFLFGINAGLNYYIKTKKKVVKIEK